MTKKNPPVVVLSGGKGDFAQALHQAFLARKCQVLAPGKEELNMANEASVTSFFSSLKHLDIFVHNAGILRDQRLVSMRSHDWEEVQRVHLRGGFLGARAALQKMKEQQGGHLLFISSRSARTGPVGQANYAAAKAGLVALAQSIAREYGADNIRCNTIFPGFLPTRMTRHFSEPQLQRVRDECTLKRFNTIQQAADLTAHLALLDHISGQIFQLDSRIDSWT